MYFPSKANGRVGEIVDDLQLGRNPLVGNNLGGFPFSATTIDPKSKIECTGCLRKKAQMLNINVNAFERFFWDTL